MPEISRFFGIIITIYWKDHGIPHFHAKYQEHRAVFAIADGRLLEGFLPARALGMVSEWTAAHREDLQKDWDLAKAQQPLFPIPPLE